MRDFVADRRCAGLAREKTLALPFPAGGVPARQNRILWRECQ